MTRASCFLTSFIVAGAAALPAHAANLVENGSFEDPVQANGDFQLIGSGQSFQGWKVVGSGNIGIFSGEYTEGGVAFPAKKGKQWLDLTGNQNKASGIQQDIVTTPGKTYAVSFYIGNVNQKGSDLGIKSTVDLHIDGTDVASFTNKAGKGQLTQVWKKFSTEFVAQNSSTRIEFFNGDPPDDAENGLDGVSVALKKH